MEDTTVRKVSKDRREKKLKKRAKNKPAEVPAVVPLPQPSAAPSTVVREPKKAPSTPRMSSETRTRIAETNLAAYVALPKAVKKRRSAAFTALRIFLAGLPLRGLVSITSSAMSFYVLVFDTADHRDKALTKLAKAKYKFDSNQITLITHRFGDPKKTTSVIWQISEHPLITGDEIRGAIIAHIERIEPSLVTSFETRSIQIADFPSGRFAVRFLGKAPSVFEKQLKVGPEKLYISQEPTNMCRFCHNSGHNLFECNIKCDKELGAEILVGSVGKVPDDELNDEDMS